MKNGYFIEINFKIDNIMWVFFRVFWLNIMQVEVYLWYKYYCSKLFREMRRDVNFGKGIIKIVRKSKKDKK